MTRTEYPLDEFTLPETFEDGRWYAVAVHESGDVLPAGEILYGEDSITEAAILVVKDSAKPVMEDGEWTTPGSWDPDDRPHDFGDFWDSNEFEQKWLDAVAIAESRNRRADVCDSPGGDAKDCPTHGAADFVPDGGDRA